MSFAGARRITVRLPRRRALEPRSQGRRTVGGRELLGARVRPATRAGLERLARAGRESPGRACSSDRASDLRRCANASRTRLATAGRAARPDPPQPDQRRVDPRARREHGPVDGPQQPDLAGELDEHARRRRRRASRDRRAAGRRSRAGPSASTTSSPGSSAIVRRSSGVAIEYGRLATIRIGAGSSVARSTRIASPKCSSTFPMLGGDPLQRRTQAFVELDHVHRRRARRELGGQRPLATADLEHDVVAPRDPPRGRSRASRLVSARKFCPSLTIDEDPGRVRLHGRLELGVGDAAHLGEQLRGRDDVGRLVRPPADGLRRQERRVRLDQKQVVGDRPRPPRAAAPASDR